MQKTTNNLRASHKESIDIFLLCFISMIGLWFIYHGIFANKHYDISHSIGKFPIKNNLSSLGGDFGYPWNGAKNFLDPQAGVYQNSKCFLPSTAQCYHFAPTPFVPLVFSGFSKLSFFTSYRIYLIFLLALWAAGIYTLSKMYTFKTSHFTLLIAIVLLTAPFHYEFERGNWHSLVFLPVLLAFYSQNWKNDVICAALFVTLAMFLKIHPGLFIVYFFIKGHIRTCSYATLFAILFMLMSGGLQVYDFYMIILKSYTKVMSAVGGWGNHSTSSMITTVVNLSPDLKRMIAYAICSILALGTFVYIFIMNKKSNSLMLKIELCLVLIIANITPVTASRYSLIYIPFIILTLAEALDNEAIRKKLNRYWPLAAWLIATLACYTLMSPLSDKGEFNVVAHVFNPYVLALLRQLWFILIILFSILIYFHWQIGKSVIVTQNITNHKDNNIDNPASTNGLTDLFRNWYAVDLSSIIESIKRLSHNFRKEDLIDLLDPVSYRYTKSMILIRGCALLLFIYLVYFSLNGSIMVR